MELAEFFQENSVNVWHDFGYSDVSHLTHIRGLSGQIFPITVQGTCDFFLLVQNFPLFKNIQTC